MFHRYGKAKSSQTQSPKDLIRIVPSSLLLSEEKRSVLLRQIKEICALEEARYDSLCLSLLHNLANHYQNLPETLSYYSQPGGLLDHALNRTEAALNLFQHYLIHDAQGGFSEEQKLWQYALFSAAILQGIGKLQIEFSVDLYDSTCQFLRQWNPLLENLVSVAHYYNYEFQKEADQEFRCRINLLIARFLMPEDGFSWIASHPEVLAIWLALLNEDNEAAGTLGSILVRADAIAVQRYFNQFSLRDYGSGRGGRYGRMSTFTDHGAEPVAEIEQQIGIEFLQWLTKSLESGLIMINKPPLLMVAGGLLLLPEIWDQFIKNNPHYNSIHAARNGFLSLGMHRVGPDGSSVFRFEQNATQQMHSGIIFENYAVVLPEEVRLYNISTGNVSNVSATELIYQAKSNSSYFTSKQAIDTTKSMPHLNASGHWVTENSVSAQQHLRPGVLTRA